MTKDGFEAHMGTNHLGPFLLTMLLLPCMRETARKVRVNHLNLRNLFPVGSP